MNDRELLARLAIGVAKQAVLDAVDEIEKAQAVLRRPSPAPEAGRTGDSLPPLKCAVCDEEIHATHAGVHVTAHIACSSKLKAALDTFNEEAPEAGSVPAPVPYDEHEREMGKLIDERDAYHDKLDEFVEAVGDIEACGEHSSANDPWARALELVEEKFSETPAAPPSRAETPTVEECKLAFLRAWEKSRGPHAKACFWNKDEQAGLEAVRALCLTARPEGMDAEEADEPEPTPEKLAQWDSMTKVLQSALKTNAAPPPVARETTREFVEAVAGLCRAWVAVDHTDADMRKYRYVNERFGIVSSQINSARSSLPSGEAGVDVKALRLYLAEHYGWCSPHGMSLEWCSGWDAEMTAALKAQGVPTRATKEE